MGKPAVSQELLDMLNQAIARELQVSIQYMWQHVVWSGVKGFAVKDELRTIGIAEMKHAEAIAERLNYLGGVPTTKPEPIFIGETLREQLTQDSTTRRARSTSTGRSWSRPARSTMSSPSSSSRASSATRKAITTPSRRCSRRCRPQSPLARSCSQRAPAARSRRSRGGRPAPGGLRR